MAADNLHNILLEKTGLNCPILDLYAPDIAEQLGAWFAELTNNEISKQLKYPVQIYTTFYPPDNVKAETDAFLTNELNTRLALKVTSVLNNKKQFVDELKTQIIDKIQKEMVKQFVMAKSLVLDSATLKSGLTQQEMTMAIRVTGLLITKMLEKFSVQRVFGYNINAINYYENNRARILNGNRQRRFRSTHHEMRQWVEGGPASPVDWGTGLSNPQPNVEP